MSVSVLAFIKCLINNDTIKQILCYFHINWEIKFGDLKYIMITNFKVRINYKNLCDLINKHFQLNE